ncbi:hypothetical protein KR032_008887, partial [Drosophila birchii]
MLGPKSDSLKDESNATIKQVEGDMKTNGIGWNIHKTDDSTAPSYLSEVHLSHQRISRRFGDLLNLFEDYTKILKTEQENVNPPFKLKRVLSSLTDASDCTIKDGRIRAPTCDVSSQTCWSAVDQKEIDIRDLEPRLAGISGNASVDCGAEKPSKTLQHTIHIEVESVTSATDMQRAPLRQRMWNVVTQTLDSIIACTYMIGENFTYVLFIALCLWCLFLLLGHYYSSLPTSIDQQIN